MSRFRLLALTLLLLALPLPSAAVTPNDPLFAQQWGFTSVGLTTAWDLCYGGSAAGYSPRLGEALACCPSGAGANAGPGRAGPITDCGCS